MDATLVTSTPQLTAGEFDFAIGFLLRSRNGVACAVKELSPRQWAFKADANTWSICEVVEHLGTVQEFFLRVLAPRLRSAPPLDRDPLQVEKRVLRLVPDRSVHVVEPGRASLAEAPPPVRPAGRLSPAEALEKFFDTTAGTADFLKEFAPECRLHAVEHPAMGPMDGYHWVLYMAGHAERHQRQILDLKAAAEFPAN